MQISNDTYYTKDNRKYILGHHLNSAMGCGISKGDLKAVEEVTGMSESDVKEAYKGFKDENKADKINLDKFTKLVSSMNTNKGTSQVLIQRSTFIVRI